MTALSLLLFLVWIGSQWIGGRWAYSSDMQLVISGGAVVLSTDRLLVTGFLLTTMREGMAWGFECFTTVRGWHLQIPLWAPFLCTSVASGVLWNRVRKSSRLSAGKMCPACDYVRTGLIPSAPCPECGAPCDT